MEEILLDWIRSKVKRTGTKTGIDMGCKEEGWKVGQHCIYTEHHKNGTQCHDVTLSCIHVGTISNSPVLYVNCLAMSLFVLNSISAQLLNKI